MRNPSLLLFWCVGFSLIAFRTDAAPPDAPRTVAVISLIADVVRVVGQEPTAGSRISRGSPETTAVSFDTLELVSLRAATRAALQADAKATYAPLKITDADLYGQQNNFLSDSAASLPSQLLSTLRDANMTHLLLITRHRGDFSANTGRVALGSGKVEGVGFYLNRDTRVNRVGDGQERAGFLAPFIYARVTLIDLSTMAATQTQFVNASEIIAASATGDSADPWMTLSDAEKVKRLQDIVDRSIGNAVTRLLKNS